MKLLVEIPEKAYNRISEKTEVLYSEMIIANGTPLDGLTNGEVFMKMYGISQDDITYVDALVPYALIKSDKLWSVEPMVIPLTWWNAKWGEKE